MKRLEGLPVGPGYAVGHVCLIDPETRSVPVKKIRSRHIEREIGRFDRAVEEAVEQIDDLLTRLRAEAQEGMMILQAHRLILQDEMLIERTRKLIRVEQINAEAALEQTLCWLEEAFLNLEESYFKERGSDIRFAGSRVLANLMGEQRENGLSIPPGAIVIAHDLSPAQTIELTARRINGFVTEVGGRTSHTAILARAMEIPAVVGASGLLNHAVNGQTVVIDGTGGNVVLNPDQETLHEYRAKRRRYRAEQRELLGIRELPATTRDDVRITLEGNIEYLAEIESLISHGGEGIGLYRTEYLFMRSHKLPDEEKQYEEYCRMLEEIAPLPATMRTLDIGADKLAEALHLNVQTVNPALGLRGVRLTLRYRELLITQLRALLRASVNGKLRLLIPFVTSMSDVLEVKALIEEVKTELRQEGLPFAEDIPFGAMIEVPSAAIIADILARECDFFSIGTNDLVQYTMAADRNNDTVANLHRPLHPSVIRLIKGTCEAARAAGIEVAICGEMAGEPVHAPVLIGCGLNSFSMNPISISPVKQVIRRCSAADCRALLEEILCLPTATAVERRVHEYHQALMR